jgi:hypothetical protein
VILTERAKKKGWDMREHTPSPWRAYESPLNKWIGSVENGEIVCDRPGDDESGRWEANVRHILRACNNYHEMLDALKAARAQLDEVVDMGNRENWLENSLATIELLMTVISKAEA